MNKDNNSKNMFLYSLEQGEWNDIQAYHFANVIAWRRIAILAIIALVIVSLYAMYLTNEDKHKTVVFEKDSLGNLTALGIASRSFNVDNKMIAHQLVNFIIALREVPLDINVKRRNIDLVHKMGDSKSSINLDQLIIDQYTKVRGGVISVMVTQVKPIGNGHSWIINWNEYQQNSNEATGISSHWSSTITFRHEDNLQPSSQIVNPTGVLVSYIHPVEDINDANMH